jgi:hypothetical protein
LGGRGRDEPSQYHQQDLAASDTPGSPFFIVYKFSQPQTFQVFFVRVFGLERFPRSSFFICILGLSAPFLVSGFSASEKKKDLENLLSVFSQLLQFFHFIRVLSLEKFFRSSLFISFLSDVSGFPFIKVLGLNIFSDLPCLLSYEPHGLGSVIICTYSSQPTEPSILQSRSYLILFFIWVLNLLFMRIFSVRYSRFPFSLWIGTQSQILQVFLFLSGHQPQILRIFLFLFGYSSFSVTGYHTGTVPYFVGGNSLCSFLQ